MVFPIIKKHQVAILTMMMFGIIVSLGLSFVQPLEYRGSFSVLVVEKEGNLDGYAASKSAERLSTSLGQVLVTESFADKVTQELGESELLQDTRLFPADEQRRREQWKRHLDTRILPDVGLLRIAVYHPDREHALTLATAVASALVKEGAQYVGGRNIEIQLVDSPLASKRPARPNFLVNAFAGMVLGGGTALGFFVLRALSAAPAYEEQRDGTFGAVPAYPQTAAEHAEPVVRQPARRPQPIPMAQEKRGREQAAPAQEPASKVKRSWNYAASAAVSTEPSVWRMP